MTSLYQEYSSDLSFRAFRKIVIETLPNHLSEHTAADRCSLMITPYLEVRVVQQATLTPEEGCSYFPLEELVQNGKILLERVDELAYQFIIVPSKVPQKKMDILNMSMMKAYREGASPELLRPYFLWKLGEVSCEEFTLCQLKEMADVISAKVEALEVKHPDAYSIHDNFEVDDPWQHTRGFGEDKYMMAYYNYIQDQLLGLSQRI